MNRSNWSSASKNPAYGRAAWRRARLAALQRAGWRCEARLDGCQGAAVQVDHRFGLAADPDHRWLRAVCRSCHQKITSQQSSRGHREPPAEPRTRW